MKYTISIKVRYDMGILKILKWKGKCREQKLLVACSRGEIDLKTVVDLGLEHICACRWNWCHWFFFSAGLPSRLRTRQRNTVAENLNLIIRPPINKSNSSIIHICLINLEFFTLIISIDGKKYMKRMKSTKFPLKLIYLFHPIEGI